MNARASTLMIPVENQVRELDGKLLLACVAAERGFSVVLGSRAYLHFAAASLPRGVYLAKSMRRLSDQMFGILRRLGHEIVAFDEEGLLRPSDERYYARRMSPVAVPRVSALLAWGPDDAATFRRFPPAAGVPVHVTGNPRVDMLRPELRRFYDAEVRQIRERFGRLVLINSNFGLLNHYVPSLRAGAAGGEPLDEFTADLTAHRRVTFEHFCRVIPELARALPDRTVLIRPHPVESHEPWLALARDHANVAVVHEGSVVPWLMAADLLIQNGCQTAVEGALVGTPVVSFRPARHALDVPLVESVSHQAESGDRLIEVARAIVAGELGARAGSDRDRELAQHIAALEGPLAAERMVDVLGDAGYAAAPPAPTRAAQRLGARVHNHLRTASKRLNMARRGHRNSRAYHDHRFPPLSVAAIQQRTARLSRQLGRFGSVRVRERSRHLFTLEV